MSKSDTNKWLEEVVELSMLYDFYGELLSENAKRAFEGYVLQDMSLSELSEETGISRQGVYDTVNRTVNKLRLYEKKLKLVEKFENMKQEVDEIRKLAEESRRGKDETEKIVSIAEKMLESY